MSATNESTKVEAERALLSLIITIAQIYKNSNMSEEEFTDRVISALDDAQPVTVGVFE